MSNHRVIEHLKTTIKIRGTKIVQLLIAFLKGFVAIGGSFLLLCVLIPGLAFAILFAVTIGWFVEHPLETKR
ncbi:MAG: hypothetical protein KAS32_09785 [Candidatus Peribacteraceae bacterium]|nr:hypothetical protein [Candidatus Peribacteraceae bacterium]